MIFISGSSNNVAVIVTNVLTEYSYGSIDLEYIKDVMTPFNK